jgi:hypothetical protein
VRVSDKQKRDAQANLVQAQKFREALEKAMLS